MKNILISYTSGFTLCTFLSIAIGAQTINIQLQGDYTAGVAISTPIFAVGDVNNDGLSDLVTLNPANLSSVGPISVFLNNGSGGFGAPLNTPNVNLSPTDAVIRDFNGDGNADLVLSQTGTFDGINIRLGNGTGNFLTGTSITAERGSPSIVTADFNGDGNLDLAVCNNLNELRVLNGTGSGTFSAATPFTTATVCQDLVTADFNVDGKPDLAVAMRLAPSDRGVQVFLNSGTSFNAPLNIAGVAAAQELIVADFNRDCIPDLAVGQFESLAVTPIFILLGNGAGGFTSAPTINLTNFPHYMAIGDFNRDKKVDLVLRHNINNNPTANNLTILPGNGAGGFGTPFEASIAPATSSTDMKIATIDANRDGKDDLIIGRQGGFALYNGNSPRFTQTENDFDGDLKADLAVFRPSNGAWYMQRSTLGNLSVPWGLASDKLVSADYDGDGISDIAVWREGTLAYYYILNSSNNTVRIEQFGQTGDQASPMGDWDGDGKADPAVYRNGSQSYFFFRGSLNNPNGSITYLPWGTNGDQPVRGDFDGDGKQDAAVFRPSNAVWYIFQSSNLQIRYGNWGLASDRRVTADYDGDGKTDFAVFRPSNNVWYILNSSNGAASYYPWGTTGDSLVPGDYNGDGKAEAAVYRPSDQRWWIPPCGVSPRVNTKFGASGDIAVQAVP